MSVCLHRTQDRTLQTIQRCLCLFLLEHWRISWQGQQNKTHLYLRVLVPISKIRDMRLTLGRRKSWEGAFCTNASKSYWFWDSSWALSKQNQASKPLHKSTASPILDVSRNWTLFRTQILNGPPLSMPCKGTLRITLEESSFTNWLKICFQLQRQIGFLSMFLHVSAMQRSPKNKAKCYFSILT